VIRKITSGGTASTLAGPAAGGTPYNAGATGTTDSTTSGNVRFNAPHGLAIDAAGTYLYVADTGNSRIRRVTLSNGTTTTFAGRNDTTVTGATAVGTRDGSGAGSTGTAFPLFNAPQDLAIDSSGNLYVADTGNSRIRRIVISSQVVTTWAGPNTGTLTTGDRDGTGAGTAGSNPLFSGPQAIAVDGSGNVYLADTANNKIRRITSAAVVTTFSGPAAGTTTSGDLTLLDGRFNGPAGITADGAGDLYVADTGNNKIRQVVIVTGAVTTAWGPATGTTTAGSTNSATPGSVRFNAPQGIAMDVASGSVYVADTGSSTIRVLPTSGTSTTLAGSPGATGDVDATGATARFDLPGGVAFNPSGSCDRPAATLRVTVTPVAVPDNETPRAANVVQTCGVTWADHAGDLDWTPANYVSTGATDYAPTTLCNPLANDHGRDSTGSQIDTALLDYTLSFAPGQTSFTNNCSSGVYPTTTVGCFGMAADGTWSFTPPTNWSGAVRVNYGATGAGGDSSRTIMTLHVVPLAVDDSVTGASGDTVAGHPASALAGDVLAGTISSGAGTGGADAGTGLSFVAWGAQTVTPGGGSSPTPVGTLSLNGNGTYSYTPDGGWWGTISVPYTIKDSTGQTATATLTITVTPLVTIVIEKMGVSASQWVDMAGSEWAVYTDSSLSPGSRIAAGDLASVGTGRWTVSWLNAGVDYWIVETKAMTGFELLAAPVAFHLAADGTLSLASGATSCPSPTDLGASIPACIVPAAGVDPARIVIRDMTSVVLPKAGGSGTEGFVWTGLGLLAAAGLLGLAILAVRRRRTGRHARYQDLI